MTPSDVNIVADNIEDFIEVPDGINRLRKAVLTLAVSGKLVPQDESEGTAEDLYNQIQAERTKESDGRKRRVKELQEITPEEIPFDIPKSWKWVRLEDIFLIERGGSPRPIESYITDNADGLNWIKIGDTEKDGKYIYKTKEKILKSGLYKTRMVNSGDLLLTNSMSFGRPYILKIDGCIHDGWLVLKPYHNETVRDFFYYSLLSPSFFHQFEKLVSGAVVKNLNADKVKSSIISIPPIEEQKRIVEKIEELMSKIDELEIKKKERDEARIRLARSAMQSLGKGDSKIAFEQLIELIKTPSDIKELENALLTLAVSGKLVPQDESEGTAEDLYNQIQAERTKESDGRKRRVKELPEITPEEIPFEIPKSWKWVRLGDCMSISSGDLLNVKEATKGDYLVYGGNGVAGRHTAFNAVKNTIVIGRVGALCGIAHTTETNAWVTDNAFIVNYPEKLIDRDFFKTTLNYLNLRRSHRGSAQPVISGLSVYPIPMPLPPLTEQKRIVKKVEEVIVLTNKLRNILI